MTGIWLFFAMIGSASASSRPARRRDDVAARRGQLGDLLQRGVDVGRRRRGHRLHAHLGVAADEHLADLDLAGLASAGPGPRGLWVFRDSQRARVESTSGRHVPGRRAETMRSRARVARQRRSAELGDPTTAPDPSETQPVSTTGARTIAKAEPSAAGTRSTTIRSVIGVPSYQVTVCSRASVNAWAHSPAVRNGLPLDVRPRLTHDPAVGGRQHDARRRLPSHLNHERRRPRRHQRVAIPPADVPLLDQGEGAPDVPRRGDGSWPPPSSLTAAGPPNTASSAAATEAASSA